MQRRTELAGGEVVEGVEAGGEFGGGDGAPSAHLRQHSNVEL